MRPLPSLAVVSNGVLAQDKGTVGGDQNAQPTEQRAPDYHNDDSPYYPFTA